MFEECYLKFVRRAGAALAMSAVAFAALAGDPPRAIPLDPQKLGARPVAQNEEAVVALLAQRIISGIASGDPYLYLNFIAPDYSEATAEATAKSAAGREAFLQKRSQPASALVVSNLYLDNTVVNEREASCTIIAGAEEKAALRVNLHFAKRPEGWMLLHSNGLSKLARAIAASPQPALAKTGAGARSMMSSTENEAAARSFIAKKLSEEHQIGKLTRKLTQERLHRSLFSTAHGSAFFARVQQFNAAPFIAASYVQLVTDPAWNRIVYGDYQKWIKAYDGSVSGIKLLRPHGIAVDANGTVYVADTGNRRVLVLEFNGPASQLELSYVGSLGENELSQPMEVAWDDRGTIFNGRDDMIWVSDGGANELLAYRAQDFSAAPVVRYQSGELVLPAALAIGRFEGRSDGNIYLADAGSRRLHRFYFDGQTLTAVNSIAGEAEMVPAGLATDHWGNVYLADASYRRVQKYSANLTLLTTLQPEDDTFQPARFQPLFGSMALPGHAEPLWSGYDQAFLLEQWSENSGGRRFELGIDFVLEGLRLSEDLSSLDFAGKLTDAGYLKTEMVEAESNVITKSFFAAWQNAGEMRVEYDRRNANGELIAPGYYKLRHTLQSTYDKPQIVRESEAFYLPLYYYEDCGSIPARDAHHFRGQRRSDFGTGPQHSVVTDPQAVIYRFAGLQAEIKYEIKAGFFAALGEVEQALHAGQDLIHQVKLPASASSATEWLEIPAQAVAGGKLDIRILKTGGSGEANVTEIWLREAHFDAQHPPQPDKNIAALPRQFALAQNYPNPFNPGTTISFELPEGFRGQVTLRIYNMLGAVVRELAQRDLAAGNHREVWDGLDAAGRRVATGVYVYQLRAGSFSATRKLVMMK